MSVPLFEPIKVRSVEIPNRIAIAPMCQYAAPDNGVAGDWHLMNLGQYSMGAAGLVMAEATHVSLQGRITKGCLALCDDETEAGLKRTVDFCREWGVSKLAIQIAHAGRKASVHVPLKGGQSLPADEGAWQTVSASAVPYGEWHTPQPLDDAGIKEIKQQFVNSTKRAIRLGFDLFELHAAHGYLMNQFLSPLSNKRDDGYGGSLDNRMRLLLETFELMRAEIPDHLPLGVRLSAVDWVEGGIKLEDTVKICSALKELDCDFIDVSSGGLHAKQKIKVGPGYQVAFAEAVKREVGIQTWAVGMIVSPKQANEIIADGQADMVMLARGAMFNPRWAWHAALELGAETPYSDQYMRCRPDLWPGAELLK
jgi:2,4-dienoyl-CoA reductase-like NADH-dependent reductase (Old Yellow Enzyme family)